MSYWTIPEPDGFFEVGAIDLRALILGNLTVDRIYIDSETANIRIKYMAWGLLHLRFKVSKLQKKLKELESKDGQQTFSFRKTSQANW